MQGDYDVHFVHFVDFVHFIPFVCNIFKMSIFFHSDINVHYGHGNIKCPYLSTLSIIVHSEHGNI